MTVPEVPTNFWRGVGVALAIEGFALMLLLMVLAACSPDKPVQQQAKTPDDNCVGHTIKTDGWKICMERK